MVAGDRLTGDDRGNRHRLRERKGVEEKRYLNPALEERLGGGS